MASRSSHRRRARVRDAARWTSRLRLGGHREGDALAVDSGAGSQRGGAYGSTARVRGPTAAVLGPTGSSARCSYLPVRHRWRAVRPTRRLGRSPQAGVTWRPGHVVEPRGGMPSTQPDQSRPDLERDAATSWLGFTSGPLCAHASTATGRVDQLPATRMGAVPRRLSRADRLPISCGPVLVSAGRFATVLR